MSGTIGEIFRRRKSNRQPEILAAVVSVPRRAHCSKDTPSLHFSYLPDSSALFFAGRQFIKCTSDTPLPGSRRQLPPGKLFKLMESLAIEKCHGAFGDSVLYTGPLPARDSAFRARGR